MLIAQDRVSVERYVRQPSEDWLLTEFRSLDNVAALQSVQAELSLREIYAGVELKPEELREPLT